MINARFPFLEHVGVELLKAADGVSRTSLEVQDYHLQHLGFVHGGVISTLLDNTGWYAASSSLPEGNTCVTMQINIDYLKPAKPGTLICDARVVQGGRRKVYVEVEIRDPDDRLIARATGNYAVIAESN